MATTYTGINDILKAFFTKLKSWLKTNITKSYVGLGNCDNTADSAKSVKYATSAESATTASSATSATTAGSCTGNSATATKLATARSISITDGTNTGTATSFNGSSDIKLNLPTTINCSIDTNALFSKTVPVPYAGEHCSYVMPLGRIPEPTSTDNNSSLGWDIGGSIFVRRWAGHNIIKADFSAGHGYSHEWKTYCRIEDIGYNSVISNFGFVTFLYNNKYYLGLSAFLLNSGYECIVNFTNKQFLNEDSYINTQWITVKNSTTIYNSEINNSLAKVPTSWLITKNIRGPVTFYNDSAITLTAPYTTINKQLVIPTTASTTNGAIWLG